MPSRGRELMSGIRDCDRVVGAGLPCVIFICAVLPGCSGDAVKPPPLHPVSGRVTYQGKPVTGATVMFIADTTPAAKSKNSSEPGWPARCVGEADDDGNAPRGPPRLRAVLGFRCWCRSEEHT